MFVNTRFACLATHDEHASFAPLWQPPWISRLAPEDRGHLNGLTLRDGRVRYVTSVSRSDITDGWRDRRHDGGVVWDVVAGAPVAEGLSMPHSPRWHAGALYLHNSGEGNFRRLDGAGKFEPIAFCPGYLRGLAISGGHAIVGLSEPRAERGFGGLKLAAELKARDADPRCGLQVVNLETGDVLHWLRFGGSVTELYDVVVLPGVRRPMALGFVTDEIQHTFRIGIQQSL